MVQEIEMATPSKKDVTDVVCMEFVEGVGKKSPSGVGSSYSQPPIYGIRELETSLLKLRVRCLKELVTGLCD